MTYKNIVIGWITIIKFIILLILIGVLINFGFCSINEPSSAMVIIGGFSIGVSILLILILIKWIFDLVKSSLENIE